MALNFDNLRTAVQANTDAIAKAIAVIQAGGTSSPNDQAKIDVLEAQIKADDAALAAALPPAPTV